MSGFLLISARRVLGAGGTTASACTSIASQFPPWSAPAGYTRSSPFPNVGSGGEGNIANYMTTG